jgi:hypothetical protein
MSGEMDSSTSDSVVYVRLLDEGTVVFRPSPAQPLGGGVYRLETPPDYDQEDEIWEFPPGSIVLCEVRQFDGAKALIAVKNRD